MQGDIAIRFRLRVSAFCCVRKMCAFPVQAENTSQPASQLDQAIACYLAGAELLPARRPPKSCRASMNSCGPILEHEDEGKNVDLPALLADGKLEAEPNANSQVWRFAILCPKPATDVLQVAPVCQQVLLSTCCREMHHHSSHHSSKISHSRHTGGRRLHQQPQCPGTAGHTPGHIASTSQMTLLPPHAYHGNKNVLAWHAVPGDAKCQ